MGGLKHHPRLRFKNGISTVFDEAPRLPYLIRHDRVGAGEDHLVLEAVRVQALPLPRLKLTFHRSFSRLVREETKTP